MFLECPEGNKVKIGNDLNVFFVPVNGSKTKVQDKITSQYVYLAAKNAERRKEIPPKQRVKEVLLELLDDLKEFRKSVLREIEELTDGEKNIELLLKLCSAKAGYSNLLLRDV
jgi:hypothetical protein